MGGDIIFEPAKGERFSLAGGNIVGEFVELVSFHSRNCHYIISLLNK